MAKPKELPTDRSDLLPRATLMVVSFAALCRALQTTGGVLLPGTPDTPLYLVLFSFLIATMAVFAPLPHVSWNVGLGVFRSVAALTLVMNFAQFAGDWPGAYLQIGTLDDYFPFLAGVGAAAALSGIALTAVDRIGRAMFGLLVLVWLFLGTWLIGESPHPRIDVYTFQSDSADAVLRGDDPYAMTFPDIYAGEHSPVAFYGPGVSVNGIVQNGYPYMPLTLLVATTAKGVANDVRYGGLVALLTAAVFIAFTKPGSVSIVPAVLLLSIPRSLYFLELSYTEPVVVLMLAATLFCAYRLPKATPWMLGLLFASKQYMLAAVVPAYLLVVWTLKAPPQKELKRFLHLVAKAAIAAAVVTLPFVLWNAPAFGHSAIMFHLRQPYRPDSLGFLAWAGRNSPGWTGPSWLQFLVLALLFALSVWRCPRTPAGFGMAVTVSFFGFFCFSTQAFGNYYFFVLGSECCAIGAALVSAASLSDAAKRGR